MMKVPVHTGNTFNIRCDGTHIVGNEKNCHSFIKLPQLFIQLTFEAVINVSIRFIKDEQFRFLYQGTTKENPLHLPSR